MRRKDVLIGKFPGLAQSRFQITSPPNHQYNCIAWAAEDPENLWLPDAYSDPTFTWPDEALREDTTRGWTSVFVALGYQPCDDGSLEPGFQKVAIYATEFGPEHVARQLPSGLWTSKLGSIEDIEHELEGLVGDRYGSVTVFLRRPIER